ncbi:hypothetical protein EIB71_01740 [Kaistella daneshvariae]|jgi:hypothetical protein|uniref:Uncharacterized protein n=1 Tax=Kaistella daneshvariae TaxID=2487074 RepID=A0A3N0WWG0_9FLAO|nr:hypothetical protein [Kaistella daneshvariae]AZI66476.1 hypothetical protein EIB71_01740 [Kaistella daneshvariae]ROI09091.1 hypothetical protein EGI11_06680 [Kaistella daneshvariae]
MKTKKKYKKQVLKSLKKLAKTEYDLLETMTNLMLLKEFKDNKIEFKEGDTFSFEDNIFDYSEDENIRNLAKLRKKIMLSMQDLVENSNFKDKEIEFLA